MKSRTKVIERQDRKARLELFDHGDGFFSFEEAQETIEHIPGYGPSTYWHTINASGLYDNAVEAEREATASIPWVRSGDIRNEQDVR